jgi:hypothetical protein
MFKKILSLSIIALMLLSVIGVANAGTITLQYPADVSSMSDNYRYSGDAVHTLLFVHNSTNIVKSGRNGWFDRNGYLNISEWKLFEGIKWGNGFYVNDEYKTLPGYSAVYTIPDSYIGETIYGQFYDSTYGSLRYTWLKISNYKNSNIRVSIWDRGWSRDPHVDVHVNNELVANGKNGDNVEFSM